MNTNPQLAADAAWLERDWGIVPQLSKEYLPAEYRNNFSLALDAQPTLVTNPSGGIPFWMTQFVDPEVIRVLQAPNVGAQIMGEEKKGDWTTQTAWFPMIENTGVVSSYGDFNDNAKSDVNFQFESRQSYLFQTHIEYGDLEVDRAGEARLNLVSEKNMAAAKTLSKFEDYVYHFGVSGLENYGILNEPALPAALTPTTKAAGGVKWVTNGAVTAQAAEIYADFQMLVQELITNSGGIITMNDRFKLVTPPQVQAAFGATNQFGITVRNFIKESFPNVTYIAAPRYATTGGNVVQLIAETFDGGRTGYCAFNEKMRDHRIVQGTSSAKQKKTGGSWGFVLRYPVAFAQMIGV